MRSLVKKINTRLAFVYYPNGNKMDQMVCNDIACNCIPIVRIAFSVCTHFILITFLRILIAYLRKYPDYLGCCYIFTNSLDLDQAQHNVWHDLDPNCLTPSVPERIVRKT